MMQFRRKHQTLNWN